MEVEAKKCQDRPKKATKRGKRRNKRATTTLGPTIGAARGPWPGGRGVQLSDQKLGIQHANGPKARRIYIHLFMFVQGALN